MAIGITGKFEPDGDFPLMDAKDIEMPDGTRLSESNFSMKQEWADGISEIQPDIFYIFGAVDELDISLVEVDDDNVHEYCFEFIPSRNFTGMTITPAPRWTGPVQVVPGKTHQVSILRGIGVMICA